MSVLRAKRETALLVEALDALGDFQATRGRGNAGARAGLVVQMLGSVSNMGGREGVARTPRPIGGIAGVDMGLWNKNADATGKTL